MKKKATDVKALHSLETLRSKIDRIDARILSLLSERQEFASGIGEVKRRLGLEIFDPVREHEVIRRLSSNNHENLGSDAVRGIFSEIFSAARSIQETTSVAYLGPEGSFCHQVALSLFGHSEVLRAAESIEEIFALVEKAVCKRGVVPVENSYEGSVNTTLDLLCNYELKINAETFLRVRHHLLSKQESKDKIGRLYSHPMALAQCRVWIKANLPGVQVREAESTSHAARIAAKEPDAGAIGSALSALTYGLPVIEESIEDNPNNMTRFFVIGESVSGPSGKDKTSILFSVPHKAGALYRALEPLAQKGINMTRIESRPMNTRNWEYLFYVDIEGHEQDTPISQALSEMETCCAFLKRLGSYPEGGEPWD